MIFLEDDAPGNEHRDEVSFKSTIPPMTHVEGAAHFEVAGVGTEDGCGAALLEDTGLGVGLRPRHGPLRGRSAALRGRAGLGRGGRSALRGRVDLEDGCGAAPFDGLSVFR